jgi:hypothetical protein
MKNTILFFLASMFLSFGAASIDPPEVLVDSYKWFEDEVEQVIYIDFQQLSVPVEDVVIKDNQGNIVDQKDVSKLPVDVIFELDYSEIKKGVYTVELHSNTRLFSRELILE